METVTKTGTTTRTGVRKITKDEFKNVSLGDAVLSTDISSFMRSRNIEFVAKRLKPYTRVYTFFNGIDVNKYIKGWKFSYGIMAQFVKYNTDLYNKFLFVGLLNLSKSIYLICKLFLLIAYVPSSVVSIIH